MKLKDIVRLSFEINFAEEEKELLHRALFERLLSSSIGSLVEFNVDTLEVRGLSKLIDNLSNSVPIIILSSGKINVLIKKRAIEIGFGDRRLQRAGSEEGSEVSKKELVKGSELLNSILLTISGLTKVTKLSITCVAIYRRKDEFESLNHLLKDIVLETAQKLDFEIGLNQAGFTFKTKNESEETTFEVWAGVPVLPLEWLNDRPIWGCRMKKKLQLVSLDLHAILQENMHFFQKAIKMLGL